MYVPGHLGHLRIWGRLRCSICGFVCLTPLRRNLQIRAGQLGTSALSATMYVHTVGINSSEGTATPKAGSLSSDIPCSSFLYESQYTCRVHCQVLRFGAKKYVRSPLERIEQSDKENKGKRQYLRCGRPTFV